MSIRQGHYKSRFRQPQPELSGYAEGHGERIWVFHQVRTHQIVYSHSHVLDAHKALKQIPFAGKKTRPAKIRKDLWRPLAVLEFPKGMGAVGRSVFAKLREFRRRHELEWEDDVYFEMRPDGNRRVLTRQQRGLKIHEQLPNAVADMAAVLSGIGKSNKMWLEAPPRKRPQPRLETRRARATIFWSNGIFKHHARDWTPNVIHGAMDDTMKD
ncbi:unnamed protein product [Parascedosporium putredinis]|uniref:Large ribosomal subunit protein mL67 n=1 Tax=Parascedosporium putredinis TaxID=1442378 RepID=A0A9P1HAA6_9PEZI|nr:unnamed protein product [Parascedosporium putredinis]CAI8003863.1 unnamed protein product [Parascedosporium putredinis]